MGNAVTLAVPVLPRNTRDPRWRACAQHRTACDCREAEHAEEMHELHYYLDEVRTAALDILVGHRLFHHPELDEPGGEDSRRAIRGDGPLACQCTGCRLMRAADIGGLLLNCDDSGVVLTSEQREERRQRYLRGCGK